MRKIVAFILLMTFAIVACDNETPPTPALNLTSPSEATFTSEGGLGVISYSVDNPDGESAVTAQTTVEWVSNLTVGAHSISYTVAPNPAPESRSGEVVVKYDDQEARVAIVQEARAYDYLVEAEAFQGVYYGTRYSDTPNYYFCIAESVGSDNTLLPESVGYYIDLYGIAPDEDSESITLPEGVYTLDMENTYAEGTISEKYCNYFRTDRYGNYSDDDIFTFVSATLTVSADEIVLDAESVDGKLHRVIYKGDAVLEDQSSANDYFSTLTSDYELDLSDAVMVAEYYHDFYCDWEANWLLYIVPASGTGDMLMFDIVTDELSMERGIDDTYYGMLTFMAHSFVPGKIENWGSWYYRYEGGKQSGVQAPLMGGELVITKNSDGTHTLDLTATDDAPQPNTITAHWRGVVEMVDKSSGVGPAQTAAKSAQMSINLVK